MIILWTLLGVMAAILLSVGLIIGISYMRISAAWAWQPKNVKERRGKA